MSTKYKRGNYSTLKLGDESTSNIKEENTFFHNSFLLVKLCVFYFSQCVTKKSQHKKTIRKTMKFGSTNWVKKKKVRNTINVLIYSQ